MKYVAQLFQYAIKKTLFLYGTEQLETRRQQQESETPLKEF